MRGIFLIVCLGIIASANGQPVWQQNKLFVDSLISMYRTKNACSLTRPTLKHAKKKRRLDIKLIEFLNSFYYGEFDSKQIERILQSKFRQSPWRFDQKGHVDSFFIYKGRLRSFGNIEPFITYIVLNDEVIGTHVTLRIRSRLDCLQLHDQQIPDLLYLATLIPDKINFPFKEAWTEYFDSEVWIRQGLPIEFQKKIRELIDTSSATPLDRRFRTTWAY